MHFEDVVIEITRRCNMTCDHCLRGPAQNKDMQTWQLYVFLKNCTSIGTLTISGGEPSLNVQGIQDLLEVLRRRDLDVENFYMVVNGSESCLEKDFMLTLLDLWLYQENHDVDGYEPMVQMSVDPYHDEDYQSEVRDWLSAFKFFSDRESAGTHLIAEGRAKNKFNLPYGNGTKFSKPEVYKKEIDFTYDAETPTKIYSTGDTMLYLNCKGLVTTCCELSYRRQDHLGWSLDEFNNIIATGGKCIV